MLRDQRLTRLIAPNTPCSPKHGLVFIADLSLLIFFYVNILK